MPSLLVYASLLFGAGIEESAAAVSAPSVLVVVGAPGAEEYGKQFRQWAERWREAAERGKARFALIGLDEAAEQDREALADSLGEEPKGSSAAFWLVLIGHGTFDGKTARFNLRGPDVSAGELAEWLKPLERPLAIINCASASGPFINALSGSNRVIVTATKSGVEHNFARFGDYLSRAMADPKADLDKDEQTSLLEAYLLASAGAQEFYVSETRLATEHALLDDNGDALGTPADWFKGVRAVKTAKDGAAPDGLLAGQLQLVPSDREQRLPPEARTRRDAIERQLAQLREQKAQLAEEDYYSGLEDLLVELARLYEPFDAPAEEDAPSPPPEQGPEKSDQSE
ncbi:MAG TPA: hypothetical protein VHC19_18665 [Pirellulales bacterium]|nr:hypothetical protein [Pirellulales bacterium]